MNGTHVIYVLHDGEQPELYGNLPKHPTIPFAFVIWKFVFKPVLGALSLLGLLGVFFHWIMIGPKKTPPEPPVKEEAK